MSTLTLFTSPRVATSWPELFLRKGRKLYPIKPDQFSAVRERFNDGRGQSEIRSELPMGLFNQYGEYIGFISYNGRGWLVQLTGCNQEIPVPGFKTCAQRDAEGWQ